MGRGRSTGSADDRPEAPSKRRDRPERVVAGLRGEAALGILDASSDAVLAVGADGTVAYANAMAAEVFGAPTAVLVGQPADLLLPHLAAVVQALRTRRAGGDLTAGPAGEGGELSAMRMDGTRFPATVWVTPVSTRRGMLVAATVRDLTSRHETEARLQRFAARAQEHEDAVRAVLGAVTEVALVLADNRGRVTAANRAAERLLAYKGGELSGVPTTRLSDPDDLAAAAAELGLPAGADPLVELARSGLPTAQEWTWLSKDGERRSVALRVSPVGDPRDPSGFVCAATERAQSWEPVLAARTGGDRLLLELDDAPTRALRWQVGGGWARRR
jgi:PAS domain S-box-containing protein